MELLEVKPAIADRHDPTTLSKENAKVKFEDVSFKYSESALWLIQNLFLSIKP